MLGRLVVHSTRARRSGGNDVLTDLWTRAADGGCRDVAADGCATVRCHLAALGTELHGILSRDCLCLRTAEQCLDPDDARRLGRNGLAVAQVVEVAEAELAPDPRREQLNWVEVWRPQRQIPEAHTFHSLRADGTGAP